MVTFKLHFINIFFRHNSVCYSNGQYQNPACHQADLVKVKRGQPLTLACLPACQPASQGFKGFKANHREWFLSPFHMPNLSESTN